VNNITSGQRINKGRIKAGGESRDGSTGKRARGDRPPLDGCWPKIETQGRSKVSFISPECTKTRLLSSKIGIFWGGDTAPSQTHLPLDRGTPLPTPLGAFGASILAPTALDLGPMRLYSPLANLPHPQTVWLEGPLHDCPQPEIWEDTFPVSPVDTPLLLTNAPCLLYARSPALVLNLSNSNKLNLYIKL